MGRAAGVHMCVRTHVGTFPAACRHRLHFVGSFNIQIHTHTHARARAAEWAAFSSPLLSPHPSAAQFHSKRIVGEYNFTESVCLWYPRFNTRCGFLPALSLFPILTNKSCRLNLAWSCTTATWIRILMLSSANANILQIKCYPIFNLFQVNTAEKQVIVYIQGVEAFSTGVSTKGQMWDRSIILMAFASMSAVITLRLWSSSQVMNTHLKQAHTPGWRCWMKLWAYLWKQKMKSRRLWLWIPKETRQDSLHGRELLDFKRIRRDLGSNCCFSSRVNITLTRFPLTAFNKWRGASSQTFQLLSQMSDRRLWCSLFSAYWCD